MSNYNTQLQSNNTDLQTVLQTLQTKAAGGEQATPVISVNSTTGLITATAGTKSATHQLAFQAAQTITPTTTNQTIPANIYLGGIQTIKGDTNLVASNIVNGKSIFGVVGTAITDGSITDTSMEDGLVTRALTNYINDRVTSIGDYVFYNYSNLISVNFPVATTIGRAAFSGCSNLISVNFPAVTTINSYAFYLCSNLPNVNFPVATSIDIHAFAHCSKLTNVNFPAAITIGSSAFYYCSNLTSINFPVATTIGSYAFYHCLNLTSVNFPAMTTIGSAAFYDCSKLTSIYLRASAVCNLSNSNAFSKTGIWSTKGSIFVPASLVASYKAATNWAYFSNRIFGV